MLIHYDMSGSKKHFPFQARCPVFVDHIKKNGYFNGPFCFKDVFLRKARKYLWTPSEQEIVHNEVSQTKTLKACTNIT